WSTCAAPWPRPPTRTTSASLSSRPASSPPDSAFEYIPCGIRRVCTRDSSADGGQGGLGRLGRRRAPPAVLGRLDHVVVGREEEQPRIGVRGGGDPADRRHRAVGPTGQERSEDLVPVGPRRGRGRP